MHTKQWHWNMQDFEMKLYKQRRVDVTLCQTRINIKLKNIQEAGYLSFGRCWRRPM